MGSSVSAIRSSSKREIVIIVSHNVGNQSLRQVLTTLREARLLYQYHTSVYWDCGWKINRWLPHRVRIELSRRSYPQLPCSQIFATPLREVGRLLAIRCGFTALTGSKSGLCSIKKVSRAVDRATATAVRCHRPKAVYAYEGTALRSFQAARRQGTVCIYELPCGHWHYEIKLLREEAALRPEYAGTISRLNLSVDREALQAFDEELSLADHVLVPSHYIRRTLEGAVHFKKVRVVPYGADESDGLRRPLGQSGRKLRVLFVGGLTQRKGIGYLIDAVKMMGSAVELTLVGSKVGTCAPIDSATREYRWVPGAPHGQILDEMARHDVMVLPSLTEGFGMVIGEALSRGLPVITTMNSGGPEIMRDGREGFFVPIRSAEAIAEKLELLSHDRDLLDCMSSSARERAREFSWRRYRETLTMNIIEILGMTDATPDFLGAVAPGLADSQRR